jgi:endonuclease/exonuclease/phosphatase (EEP) superfamily protein YafD
MKLISLNTWGGRVGKDSFLPFFSKYRETDIFCLQEVWHGGEEMVGEMAGGRVMSGILTTLFPDVSKLLPEHVPYFHPHFKHYYGLATFMRKDIPVMREGDIFVYGEKGFISSEDVGDHARNIEFLEIQTENGPLTVINFHGLWRQGIGKGDIPERLAQAEAIVSFLKTLTTPIILCGDFNLTPETESMQKLEALGLRNLTREAGVVSTRTSHYDKPQKRDMAIDHMLVSKEITVKDFKVLPDEVSDHAPLYLEFT